MNCEYCGAQLETHQILWPDGRVLMDATLKCECQKAKERMAETDRTLEVYREYLGCIDPRPTDTFEGWKSCANNTAMMEAKQYANRFPKVRSLLFSGEPGTGKTHLAGSIIWLLRSRYVPAVYVKVPKLLDRMRDCFSKNEPLEPIFHSLISAPLVVFDDLGVEKVSEFQQEKIFELIDGKYDPVKQPMIITTNLRLGELPKRYGARTYDRLLELFSFVTLKPGSYRKMLHAESQQEEEEE